MDQIARAEMEKAFSGAIAHVELLLARGMSTTQGVSARPQLEKLKRELSIQRVGALEQGRVDREWFQKTLRWVVEWVPDDQLTLIATLGRIVRAAPPALG